MENLSASDISRSSAFPVNSVADWICCSAILPGSVVGVDDAVAVVDVVGAGDVVLFVWLVLSEDEQPAKTVQTPAAPTNRLRRSSLLESLFLFFMSHSS